MEKTDKEISNTICLINEEGVEKIATELSRNQGSPHTISNEALFLIIKYATKKDLLKLAISEIYDFVARIIVERLNNEVVTQKEADVLLGAKSCIIRKFAVNYASKEKVIEAAVLEEDVLAIRDLILKLKKEEITEEEANTLLAAKSWIIREFAVGYATREKVLEMAVSEGEVAVAISITKRLRNEVIGKKEADTLLNANSWRIREFAVNYASKEKVLEVALKLSSSEENDYIANSIIERLKNGRITKKQANTLLNVRNWKIREFAVKYATKEKVLEAALSEKVFYVAESILKTLEKNINNRKANILLNAKSWIIREFAVKYATKRKILEMALLEDDSIVVNCIIEALEKNIARSEANTLLDANYWQIREFAVKYATKEKILKQSLVEENNHVAKTIMENLIKEGVTKKELKKLSKSNNDFISNTAKIILKNI